MSDLETRLAAVEAKLEAMEARRRKLIPRELDENPALQELQQNAVKAAVDKWNLTLAEHGRPTKAEFCELKRTLLEEMAKQKRAADERETAQIVAAIEFYEKTGQNPPGFDISG